MKLTNKSKNMKELQDIDCNCNDCTFMRRDLDKYKASKQWHEKLQKEYFETMTEKLGIKNKQFQFENTAYVHFGFCLRFNKEVSFIPNVCQIENQKCFINRKDKTNENNNKNG